MLLALILIAADPSVIVTAHGKTQSFDVAALEKLGPSEAGLALEKLLRAAGLENGPHGAAAPKAEKHSELRFVVLATAKDGYQAVFSVAELTDGLGSTQAYVVWKKDGQSLDTEHGPFRLSVPTDKKGARAIHQVVKLELIDVRKR